jgi:uncharacterized protein
MYQTIADELSLKVDQVEAALDLLDDDNTVPFIARYRKDATGNLDEVQIRDIESEAEQIRRLEDRRETIRESIDEQDELTDELDDKIDAAETVAELEDLYAPYRPKRKTRGKRALDAGLEPVAEALLDGEPVDEMLADSTTDEYETPDDVLDGARDIIAEKVADEPDARKFARRRMQDDGLFTCDRRRGADEDETFEIYYDFSIPVTEIEPHQLLAIRRGEKEKALSAGIEVDDDRMVADLEQFVDMPDGPTRGEVQKAVEEGWDRLLHPRTERQIRGDLEDEADAHAIGVFAVNLENLLLKPPLPNRRVLGLDPGYRSGCKLAAVDENGALLDTAQIFVHDNRSDDAEETIAKMVDELDIDVVAVGNGTASREAEEVVADVVTEVDADLAYAMVDEAGASVYSASKSARREFPDLDVEKRGAISIARRLQDPLAELVKIDPQSIGVGMYQHDVDQTRLTDELANVVEDVVHAVGIDLNAASRELLSHVSGIGPALGGRIVEHRNEHGAFDARSELLDVRGVGSKTYEQAAGFLRIRDGGEPLDQTGIHPSNYEIARELLDEAGESLGSETLESALESLERRGQLESIAERHDVGPHTLGEITEALTEPGRDPRDELEPPELRSDVLSMEDLQPGMEVSGTVRNVVDFGAFVDIGVKEDGLVHISEMANKYVENPHEVVGVGDQVDVRVQSVDEDRGRIGLSIAEANG